MSNCTQKRQVALQIRVVPITTEYVCAVSLPVCVRLASAQTTMTVAAIN